jgi:tyrosyl-tRNA synthetase
VVSVAAGAHKPRELLVAAGLASSRSEAERLLRQRAVRLHGDVLDARGELVFEAGQDAGLSVGPARHVRLKVLP